MGKIHPSDLEEKLGFDQIRHRLVNYCLSATGAALVHQKVRFSTDLGDLKTQLHQNLEFRQLLEKGEEFPSRYFYDATEWLARMSLEGNYLEERELLDLAYSLETILSCRSFLIKSKESYPELYKLTAQLTISDSLVQVILANIDENASVKDSASPELSRIRKRLREEQSRLRRLAEQIFKRAVEEKWVPDGALPTIREGRLVIPVLAENKRRLKGFILDESATGQTVFIEPAEMLDTNNEIRDLEHAEKREVIKILRDLTAELRAHHSSLEVAFEFLATIDFVRAKGKLSLDILGDLPMLEDAPALTWYRARHPLLHLSLKGKREVVPLEIDLNLDNRMLLVSGPNAGGKSVSLKTVGLLQYMLQCGLLVPLSDRSRAGIFHEIFLDIGDQQSIENDLSTYSSHLRNMAFFIQHATDRTLVLMDELGAGTDPNFGGAIAQSVLQSLLRKGVWGVATTHYYNLKLFAGHERGIQNAAMRFDDNKLEPLYILDIGKPGSSFALEIARKTGLPSDTLSEAERLVGKELAGFETLVRNLERERVELTEQLSRLEKQEMDLKKSIARYQSLSTELESRKKEIIDKAKTEAQQLLKNTNREIEKTIRHIRENKAERKETLKVRKNLQELTHRVQRESERKEKLEAEPLQEGDRVRILGQEGSGVIHVLKGKNAVVQFGDLKSVVNVSKLEKIGRTQEREIKARVQSSGISMHTKRAQFNSTLDVRGKRVEEVIPMLDQFLDTAILLGQGDLRVLHGKGEGVLRKVVRDHLKRYKEVASFGDEHVDRGGDGITVVVLK